MPTAEEIWGHEILVPIRQTDGTWKDERHPVHRVLFWVKQDTFNALKTVERIEKKLDATPGTPGNEALLTEIRDEVKKVVSGVGKLQGLLPGI